MGEGTLSLRPIDPKSGEQNNALKENRGLALTAPKPLEATSRGTVKELDKKAKEARCDLDGLLQELDRRRHNLLDWRMQVHKYRGTLMGVGFLTLGLGWLVVGVFRRSRRKHAGSIFRLADFVHSDAGRCDVE